MGKMIRFLLLCLVMTTNSLYADSLMSQRFKNRKSKGHIDKRSSLLTLGSFSSAYYDIQHLYQSRKLKKEGYIPSSRLKVCESNQYVKLNDKTSFAEMLDIKKNKGKWNTLLQKKFQLSHSEKDKKVNVPVSHIFLARYDKGKHLISMIAEVGDALHESEENERDALCLPVYYLSQGTDEQNLAYEERMINLISFIDVQARDYFANHYSLHHFNCVSYVKFLLDSVGAKMTVNFNWGRGTTNMRKPADYEEILAPIVKNALEG